MMHKFHVTPIKPKSGPFDWKVTASRKTMDYIADQRVLDDPDYKDKLPAFFTTEDDALFAARQLADWYPPAQVILHRRKAVQ